MIYGVGQDLVEIPRIERALARFGERFAHRILCEPELARFRKHRLPAAFLAKRFAAKEAFTKALGTGIHAPANWHGVWVVNLRSGKPQLEFTPALQEPARAAADPARASFADGRARARRRDGHSRMRRLRRALGPVVLDPVGLGADRRRPQAPDAPCRQAQ
jgi:holo-[acyl-carrier protein] synthase